MLELVMGGNSHTDELEVLRVVKEALAPLGSDERQRIVKYVSEIYGLDVRTEPLPFFPHERQTVNIHSRDREMSFTDRESLSPKDFLHAKQPQKVTERIACLAYYLAHYRDTPHFKTIDISKLNTDAAQLKLTNPSFAISNATQAGLLTPAGKGTKQLSAIGERYVDALPDQDAARAILRDSRPRRARKKSPNKGKRSRGATE
jgi:hypothetical protein